MIRPEAYTILAKYPSKYHHLVKMHLKFVWAQKPIDGGIHVPLPESIAPRLLGEGHRYAWPALMNEVEELSHHLPELVSAVAEKTPKLTKEQVEREGLAWRSLLEIALIARIVQAPMLHNQRKKNKKLS